MEKVNNNSNASILKNVFNKEFIVSAVIPILIFSVLNQNKMPMTGIILSGAWSIGVVLISFIKERKVNALAAMAGIFSAVGLIGTIVSNNPTFYLVSPIVQDILTAFVFFGSLFLERSLIQIIVEQTYLKNVPEDFRKTQKYKSAWRIVTFAWGVLCVSQAVIRIVLLNSVSMSSYYAISTLYNNVSMPILLALSIAFPKKYWQIRK